MPLRLLLFFLCILAADSALAQLVMTGSLSEDGLEGKPMAGVRIENIHTRAIAYSDSSGRFSIPVASDQLIQFYATGYKVLRVRIPQKGPLPSFYRLVLNRATIEIAEVEVRDRNRDFRTDSVRDRAVYGRTLEFPELNGLDVIRHPFSALSKRNRQIWAFQKEYAVFEQQKFIDFVFNAKLVEELTGMSGEQAQRYMRKYRPSYEQVRAWSEYDFFSYVKQTGLQFKQRGF